MSHLDKIIDFLSYHPGLSRPDIMAQLNLGVGETQVKMALADGLARGDLRVEGKARATRYFVTAKSEKRPFFSFGNRLAFVCASFRVRLRDSWKRDMGGK